MDVSSCQFLLSDSMGGKWCSPDHAVAWGGNDPVGEFREPALAPHRLQLFELGVGRAGASSLLRRCRLSQASRDEESDEDRLLELESLHYSDGEVGDDLPLLLESCLQGDLLEVDEKVAGPQHLPYYLHLRSVQALVKGVFHGNEGRLPGLKLRVHGQGHIVQARVGCLGTCVGVVCWIRACAHGRVRGLHCSCENRHLLR